MKLLVPDLTGDGYNLYPFASGSNIEASKTWLNAKMPLLIPSKQSFTSALVFFDNSSWLSLPA